MHTGNVEADKPTRVLSAPVLLCCKRLHTHPKEKKGGKCITELADSISHFSQRHVVSQGGYFSNPQTLYSTKQMSSSSPKRTKQTELNFLLAAD